MNNLKDIIKTTKEDILVTVTAKYNNLSHTDIIQEYITLQQDENAFEDCLIDTGLEIGLFDSGSLVFQNRETLLDMCWTSPNCFITAVETIRKELINGVLCG